MYYPFVLGSRGEEARIWWWRGGGVDDQEKRRRGDEVLEVEDDEKFMQMISLSSHALCISNSTIF